MYVYGQKKKRILGKEEVGGGLKKECRRRRLVGVDKCQHGLYMVGNRVFVGGRRKKEIFWLVRFDPFAHFTLYQKSQENVFFLKKIFVSLIERRFFW